MGTGAATQDQVDQAIEELKGVLMAGAEEVIGRKCSRVRSIAKPWWSPALREQFRELIVPWGN